MGNDSNVMEGMERIHGSLEELVGNTPLLNLGRLAAARGAKAQVIGKLERFNPGGSSKDRAALGMVLDAERRGSLRPGGTIIEPTSGNTGISLAWIARARGYRAILVMPESMSLERRALLKAHGAELVLTPAGLGMAGAIARADKLGREIPGAVVTGQFTNPANPEAHFLGTAREIIRDTGGRLDIFVAGVGTGGTVTGVGRALKAHDPSIRVVAVEPSASPVLGGGKPGPHRIQGIGAGFVPGNYDAGVVDCVMSVTDGDAIRTGRELSLREGLLAGISSGAAVWAALELASRDGNEGKRIVALLPDTGERYLSTDLFASGE